MFYGTNLYPYQISQQGYNLRNDEQVEEALLSAIQGEAAAVDLYSRLAQRAPNQVEQTAILQAMQSEQAQLSQFTNLFINTVGYQPDYDIDQVEFITYEEGLRKAYDLQCDLYEEYCDSLEQFEQSQLHGVFLNAVYAEVDHANRFMDMRSGERIYRKDYGGKPYVVDINKVTKENKTFRTAIWTGEHLQVTLMSINPGDDIGLEIHPDVDQFLRIEDGKGKVQMGPRKNKVTFEKRVKDDDAIMIPAGTWHNVINTGKKPLKLYSIYAPPEHPFGTVHKTKKDAMESEQDY